MGVTFTVQAMGDTQFVTPEQIMGAAPSAGHGQQPTTGGCL